jgi:hypothetical protein
MEGGAMPYDRSNVRYWITTAALHGLDLGPDDFTRVDGDLYIDGMDPAEWIDAMSMD